jgi:hypothetical protein
MIVSYCDPNHSLKTTEQGQALFRQKEEQKTPEQHNQIQQQNQRVNQFPAHQPFPSPQQMLSHGQQHQANN